MSRFTDRPATLQWIGLATLVGVLGLGALAASIPGLFSPATSMWTATIPVEAGAGGLGAGGGVLIGGYPQGRILLVDGESGLIDERGRPLVAIHFELPREIVLGRDAVIRKSVGIAGTNGVLDIPSPGSRARPFASDEPRVIPIDLAAPAGGSIGVLIGRRQGERIQEIAALGERFGERLPPKLRMVTQLARGLLDDAETLKTELGVGVEQSRRRIDLLARRIAAMVEHALDLPPLLARLKDDLDAIMQVVNTRVQAWTPTFEAIVAGVQEVRIDVEADAARIEDWGPRIRGARRSLSDAVNDLGAVRTRLSMLGPEVSDGLARVMARMVLAGGQLAIALDDLLPLALEVIGTRPDAASESRRLLLEAVEDVVQAGTDVRNAARRLETLAVTADAMPLGDQPFDAELRDGLEREVEELERLLDALGDLLRREIERDQGS